MNKLKVYRASGFFGKDFPFAIRKVTNDAESFNREMRFQREFWKITRIVSGCGKLLIGEKEYPIHPGSILLIHPDSVTTYDMTSKSLELYNLVFSGDFIRNDLKEIPDDFHFFDLFLEHFDETVFSGVYVLESSPKTDAVLHEIFREADAQTAGYRTLIHSDLIRLLILLMRQSKRKTERLSGIGIARKVQTVLETEFRDRLTLGILSRLAGCSENRLSMIYKRCFGTGVVAALKKIRLARAAEMLTETDDPISAVITQCGFNDVSYFYRSFEREYGCNPGNYRKQNP